MNHNLNLAIEIHLIAMTSTITSGDAQDHTDRIAPFSESKTKQGSHSIAMEHIVKTIIASALTLLIATSVNAQSFLTHDQMMERIVGKTLSGNTFKSDQPWSGKVLAHKNGKPKGKIDGSFNGESYTSKWKIKKDRWCESWDGGAYQCWQLEHVDDDKVRPWADGKPTERVWTLAD